ncbi:MAG TPA: hypothetical protein VLC28_09725, partial [Flavitalea sp.]|nr:hypothetical protein [Flavitalea sp.]
SCQGFIFPNASALTLASFGHNAGSASALMGGIQMSIGASASALVSVLENHTSWPMAAVMACCSLLALTMFILGRKIILTTASAEIVEEVDVDMISKL